MNVVTLAGNLTRDVEVRSAGGTPLASFGIAVNRKWRSKDGKTQDEVTFVDCDCWGASGENLAKYFGKGAGIVIRGRLKLDQWEDKGGRKQSKIKVVVEEWSFPPGGKKDDAPREPRRASTNPVADHELDLNVPF